MRKLLALLAGLLLTGFVWAAVNINTATKEELDVLPGVGPAKAQAIIDYRKQNGPFKSIEDLKKVSGIGDATFEKLKGQISVSGAGVSKATAPAAPAKVDSKPAVAVPTSTSAPAAPTKAESKPAVAVPTSTAAPAKAETKAAPAMADKKEAAPAKAMKEEKKADEKAKKDDKKADKPAKEDKKDEKAKK